MAKQLPYHKLSTQRKAELVAGRLGDEFAGGKLSTVLGVAEHRALKERILGITEKQGGNFSTHYEQAVEALSDIVGQEEQLANEKKDDAPKRIVEGVPGTFNKTTLPEAHEFQPEIKRTWIRLLFAIVNGEGKNMGPITRSHDYYIQGYESKLRQWGAMSTENKFDYAHVKKLAFHFSESDPKTVTKPMLGGITGERGERLIEKLLPKATRVLQKPGHDFVLPNGKKLEVKTNHAEGEPKMRFALYPDKESNDERDRVWHNSAADHLVVLTPTHAYFADANKIREAIKAMKIQNAQWQFLPLSKFKGLFTKFSLDDIRTSKEEKNRLNEYLKTKVT